jgi:transposase
LDTVIAGYEHEDIDLLKTIPGFAEVSSKTAYTAVSTIKRFQRAKQLTSYCGLVPTIRSSGERAGYGPNGWRNDEDLKQPLSVLRESNCGRLLRSTRPQGQ